jgi:hypothetical protein
VPAADPLTHAEEWDDLDWDVLQPSRSGAVCITCQHFRYEVGRHCVTLLTCPIHQGLIPQGEHLSRFCLRNRKGVLSFLWTEFPVLTCILFLLLNFH